jgi:molybdopterin molybdotransferase
MRPDWVTVSEARAAIFATIPVLDSARVPLLNALGHALDEDVDSPVDLPPWDNSGMDGFAVRSEDVRGASAANPRTLTVIDDVPAGSFSTRQVESGTAIRVSTGAPVPLGSDGVIRVEHTDGGVVDPERGWTVEVRSDVDVGKNVRERGEDLRSGARVLSRGTILRAAEIGLAASVGRQSLSVVRTPRVAILTSGDELVDLDRFDEVIAGRRIVSSNSYSLAAQVLESGGNPELIGIAGDSPESLREHLE